MVTADLDDWVWLTHQPGIGRASLRKLLSAFGSPRAVLTAAPAARRAVLGARAAVDVLAMPDEAALDLHVRDVHAWLDAADTRHVITLGDPAYPPMLMQTADPPLLLFVDGQLDALLRPALAVVGSRGATPQGLANAHAFARDMARLGWSIVSGLATGIDTAAHEGALDGSGPTIAVVGTGLNQVYPKVNEALALRIIQSGLLISEYPLGMPPLAANFPQRNRIIAGLSQGTLVVEAALQSGSLITARLAAEAGREVFAIPGSIHSPQARGCHVLLRQGAKLVETAQDLIEEMAGALAAPPVVASLKGYVDGLEAAPEDDSVLRALGHDPATLDALMARCGWPAPQLNARLLELELTGQVTRLPGGLFQRMTVA